LPLSYSISGTDAGLFNLNVTTGEVKFNTSPNYEAPTDNGANNIYDFTITATDSAGNHSDQNVALSVTDDTTEYISPAGQSVIDLGSYGKLIAPVQVDGKWYYYWDRSGEGTSSYGGGLNGDYDTTTHSVLDGLFNHDINGVTNTTILNYDGNYGTTNTYRYGTINSIKLALPTLGTAPSPVSNNISDNANYTDLAEIWDTNNSGYKTSGVPDGWDHDRFWSSTQIPSGSWGYGGYAVFDLYDGNNGVYGNGSATGSVALQVL